MGPPYGSSQQKMPGTEQRGLSIPLRLVFLPPHTHTQGHAPVQLQSLALQRCPRPSSGDPRPHLLAPPPHGPSPACTPAPLFLPPPPAPTPSPSDPPELTVCCGPIVA